MAANNDYLNTAVDRLVAMWKVVGGTVTPAFNQVVKRYDSGLTPPFVWLYPGQYAVTPVSSGRDTQSYRVIARVVIGYASQGLDNGELLDALWVLMPASINYFREHRKLILTDGQQAPQYLHPAGVAYAPHSPFGVFAAQDHLGVEFSHVLPFIVPNDFVI